MLKQESRYHRRYWRSKKTSNKVKKVGIARDGIRCFWELTNKLPSRHMTSYWRLCDVRSTSVRRYFDGMCPLCCIVTARCKRSSPGKPLSTFSKSCEIKWVWKRLVRGKTHWMYLQQKQKVHLFWTANMFPGSGKIRKPCDKSGK